MNLSRRPLPRPPSVLAGAGLALLSIGAAGVSLRVRHAHILHPKTNAPLVIPGKDGDGTLLFSGWKITPAGRTVASTGDMLLGGALSPDGTTLALANCGYNPHALHLIDLTTEKEIATLPVAKAWNGIAWSPDGQRLYVAGGIDNPKNDIYRFEKDATGQWTQAEGFKLPGTASNKRNIAGLALTADGRTLFALNNLDNHLVALDAATGAMLSSLEVGDHPGVCKLSADGKLLYVTDWGGSEVVVLDVTDAAKPTVAAHLPTGAHPNDLALSSDGRLFVSCGNADAVTVYDTLLRKPLETIKTTLTPRSPGGSTPNAVSLTPDNKTLYVANADNNAVCVVDVSARGKSRVRGFVPTGWYPTCVLVSADGKKVLIGSGKGSGSQPNPAPSPINQDVPRGFQYIGQQLNGLISILDAPTDAQLTAYTQQVFANTPYRDTQLKEVKNDRKTAVPTHVGGPSPIKHVLYIIRENRTYDQVFGDIKQGNGDPNLCLFGQEVTPNAHALAQQFVLLDNLYCNGEVSQDGHPWCDAAYTTDFNQRSWVLSYSGKGKTGGNGNVDDARTGFLWEACQRKGLTFRSYGEMAQHPSLAGHVNLAFEGKAGPGNAPPGRDTDRAEIFLAEFRQFEREGNLPRFMVMSLGEDHTRGTAPGAYTPKAMVASNDQALGKIVDGITHSSVWKETAIFVIEDDAQNGPDHVDSHRTVGLVISPYTRRGYVDSTMYQTASMLRTMELILGLPPLTQYDAAATPMFASFTDTADLTPITLLPPRIDLSAKNKTSAIGAKESARMDWSDYDRVDADALNRILWQSIKGRSAPMPVPTRRALVMNGAVSGSVGGRSPSTALHARRDADD